MPESRLPAEIVAVLTRHGMTLAEAYDGLLRREYWEGDVIEALFFIVEGDDPEHSGAKLALVTRGDEIVSADVPETELPTPDALSELLEKNGEHG